MYLCAHAFAAGTEVVVEGLTRQPAFNGLRGVVQSVDGSTGRFNVLLASVGSQDSKEANWVWQDWHHNMKNVKIHQSKPLIFNATNAY